MFYNHVLMIGSTGMLSQATYDLALKTNTLTCIARTERSLKMIEGGLDRHGPTFFPIPLDYSDHAKFMTEVERAWQRRPFDLAVAWFHDSGSESLKHLLNFLANQTHKTDFYHVLGSSAADPSRQADQFKPYPESGLNYHRVILGFQFDGNGRSRWLHHGEISNGVLNAIQSGGKETVVGTVEPWSARP